MADETYRDRFSRLGLRLVIVGLLGLATVVAVMLRLASVLPGWLARRWARARHEVGSFLLALLIALLLVSLFRRLAKQGDSKSARADDWAIALGWWIPRRYRDDLVGDILEDCCEMRMLGKSDRRICVHVVYQWLIGVLTLVPTAITTGIGTAIRQIIVPRK